MNREDFTILDKGIIHFDNGATTLKPKCVLEGISSYYNEYTANAYRGDYDNSIKVDQIYEKTRQEVANILNGEKNNVVFTSGTTESMNIIVFGFMKNFLKKDDEIILSKLEHASNLLPWFILKKIVPFKIKYAPLKKDLTIDYIELEKMINQNTKVISLAHITNTVGDIRNLEILSNLKEKYHLLLVIDAAQSVSHQKIDLKKLSISFLAFSAHKMYGPTGVGVLYGEKELLEKTEPLKYGGGMNMSFHSDSTYTLKVSPYKFEGGTPNIEGIFGFYESLKYLNSLDLNLVSSYLNDLREYAINKLKQIEGLIIYNKDVISSSVIFNYKNVFSQDLAIYLNKFHINIRSGNHCAKLLEDEIGLGNTCRITFALYNTKEEIDVLIEALKHPEDIYKDII